MHWKKEVREQLEKDVRDGAIELIPIGEPVVWCSPMIITGKKDGRLRRTVDLQRLNSHPGRALDLILTGVCGPDSKSQKWTLEIA